MSFSANDERDAPAVGRLGDHPQPQHHHDPHHHRRRRQEQPYYRAPRGERAHHSGALQWCVAVVFTVLAVAVLLGAVAILFVVLLLQPRQPYFAVTSAHLDTLAYDQQGALDDVQLQAVVEARNGNAHASARFAGLELRVAFNGTTLVVLRAGEVAVGPGGRVPLAYVARARGAPLGEVGSAAMEAAIREGAVPFAVDGEARTRWKMAGVVEVRHWTRMSCRILFGWPNGTAMDFKCRSKAKAWLL